MFKSRKKTLVTNAKTPWKYWAKAGAMRVLQAETY